MVIKWSKTAITTQEEVLDFLNHQWGDFYVKKYRLLTSNTLNTIIENPNHYLLVNKKLGIHKALIHKNVSLFYQFNDEKSVIFLLAFWDNRRDPQVLKRLLEE